MEATPLDCIGNDSIVISRDAQCSAEVAPAQRRRSIAQRCSMFLLLERTINPTKASSGSPATTHLWVPAANSRLPISRGTGCSGIQAVIVESVSRGQ